ncbi:MAG: SEL1-like repeat protein [Pacificimonas sp.]|jgi:TPR repeat protein|nr:SEL1-like repeat protein [Pacificimonas sp.]
MSSEIDSGDARFLQQRLSRAMGGDADALYELGVAYSAGCDGVGIDLIEAHKWFNLAALKGDDRAVEDRREVSADMTKDEIAAAQREARSFLSAVA